MDLDTPAMSDKAKGKQRQRQKDTIMQDAMDIDVDSNYESAILPAKSTTSIHARKTMFADSDYQRLLVENAQLRRQADLLAKRIAISKPGETSQNGSDNVKTSQAEVQHLRTRLAHSESAKDRLQRELANLRSFLLGTIAVQPTLLPHRPLEAIEKPIETVSPVDEQRREREKTPILLDDGTLQDQASSASRGPNIENSAAAVTGAASGDDQSRSQSPEVPLAGTHIASAAPAGPSAPVQSIALPPLPKPQRPRSRKRATMGDAETELLLCASKRIQRVYKHIPGLRAAAPTAPAPAREVAAASGIGHYLPFPLPWQSTRRPKSPPAELRRPSITHPRRPSAAPAQVETAPPANRRTSKRRNARSYKEANEDEEDAEDYSEDAFSPAIEEKGDGVGGTPDESGRPAKKKKKIGRPLGSPNKTKTISFNKIGNLMNQSPGLLFAGQQLQLASSSSSSSQQHPMGGMSMSDGGGGHEDGLQPEGSMEDLLAAAETMRDDASMGGEARNLRSRGVTQDPAAAVDAEIDDEWPTTIQDEIDGSGDDEYEDGGEYQDEAPTSSRPSTNRNSRDARRSVSQSARPSSSAHSKSKATSVPKGGAAPQTPNGIERQISALDVLADQAASASTGPAGQTKAQKGGRTDAAKNMQQALFSGNSGGVNGPSNGSAQAGASIAAQAPNRNTSSLGDAFTYQPASIPAPTTFYSPNFDANDSHTVSSSTATSYPSTSTSQYQPFVFPPLPQSTLPDHHSLNLGNNNNNTALPQYDTSSHNANSGTPATGYASPYPPNHLQQFPPVPDYSPSYETFTAPLPPPTQSQPTSQMTIAQQLSLPISQYHPLIDPEDLNKGMTPAAALAKKSRSPYIKWTVKEDEMLVKGIVKHGTKWDYVAKELPDRSYHQCRQRWLRGLKCGESLPKSIEHLRPQLEAAVAAYENSRNSKKEATDE